MSKVRGLAAGAHVLASRMYLNSTGGPAPLSHQAPFELRPVKSEFEAFFQGSASCLVRTGHTEVGCERVCRAFSRADKRGR